MRVDGLSIAAAVAPVLAVEEVPAVDADGRPRLLGQHGDGEHEGGEGQDDGHPRRPAPGVFLVGPRPVRHPARDRVPPRCSRHGGPGRHGRRRIPGRAAPHRHAYWMLRICFSDCASTLVGSGWKLTWAR